MKDDRLYARFTLDLPDSPKFIALSIEAKWAYVEMVIYSRRMMTDGFLANAVALAKWGATTCQELATNDPEKPSLIEVENGYEIHDFGKHQTTKSEIEELREKRKTAGQKGGQARAKALAKQAPKQKGSKSKPETETETYVTPPSDEDKGDRFEDWWKHYPKKVDKGDARKAYTSALTKTTHQTLVDGAQGYAHFCENTNRERQYMKGPARWLNVEGWANEDELDAPKQHKPSKWDLPPEAYMHPEEVEDERRRAEQQQRNSRAR